MVEEATTAISDISFSLLPADYCQRERVSDVQRIRTEFVWKSPIRFSDKVLRLKVPTVDNIRYCQLGKLAVVRDINELRFFRQVAGMSSLGRNGCTSQKTASRT